MKEPRIFLPQRQCGRAGAFPSGPCSQLRSLIIVYSLHKASCGGTFYAVLHPQLIAFLHRLLHPGSPRLCVPAQGNRCLLQGGKDDCLSCSEDMKGRGRAGVSSPDMLSVPVSSCSLLFSAAWVRVSLHAVRTPLPPKDPFRQEELTPFLREGSLRLDVLNNSKDLLCIACQDCP